MILIGTQIFNTDAKIRGKMTKPPQINHQTKIIDVKEQDIEDFGKKALVILFEYKAEYMEEKKTVAHIVIGGAALFLDKNHNEIMKSWDKEKKLPEKTNAQVINNILTGCIIKALAISQDMKLPPVIKMPFVSKKKPPEDSRYIG